MPLDLASTTKLTVRGMTALDLSAGFLDALASLSEVGLTPAEAAEVFRNRLRLGIRTYVAFMNDRVVGTASLLLEQKFIHRGGWVGHIEDVAVHRDHQQHGIGTALVQYATEEARQRGCYKVILDCFEHLVPFYERLGYRRHNLGLRIDW
jgi:glucosamine-phosphate N-acetyltransferase